MELSVTHITLMGWKKWSNIPSHQHFLCFFFRSRTKENADVALAFNRLDEMAWLYKWKNWKKCSPNNKYRTCVNNFALKELSEVTLVNGLYRTKKSIHWIFFRCRLWSFQWDNWDLNLYCIMVFLHMRRYTLDYLLYKRITTCYWNVCASYQFFRTLYKSPFFH
jgi:hypothetical protein